MAVHGGEPPENLDLSLGGLDEEIVTAQGVARDPGRQVLARREAAAYAVGLQRAVYVLTGRWVAAAGARPRRHGP
jgi:hypothetical protein